MAVNRRERTAAPKPIEIDLIKLNQLKFIKTKSNPSDFLLDFNRCFSESVLGDTKSFHLAKFIPIGDELKFSEVWLKPINEQFEFFSDLFTQNYFAEHLAFRKSALSKQHTDYSSLFAFYKQKVHDLQFFNSVDEESSIQQVFYQLPSSICSDYIARHKFVKKNNLEEFLQLKDSLVQAAYFGLDHPTDSLDLNSEPPSSSSAAESASTSVNFNDKRVFITEETDSPQQSTGRVRREKRLRRGASNA